MCKSEIVNNSKQIIPFFF